MKIWKNSICFKLIKLCTCHVYSTLHSQGSIPVQVANNCLILTDFVVLQMPEDDNMSIILGRPFLNTAGAVIDCNKGKVTFNVNDKEHTVYFPKKVDKIYGVNTISNFKTIKVGSIDCPIYDHQEGYQNIMIGSISIQYKVTWVFHDV